MGDASCTVSPASSVVWPKLPTGSRSVDKKIYVVSACDTGGSKIGRAHNPHDDLLQQLMFETTAAAAVAGPLHSATATAVAEHV
jgi:hypothetical protein